MVCLETLILHPLHCDGCAHYTLWDGIKAVGTQTTLALQTTSSQVTSTVLNK